MNYKNNNKNKLKYYKKYNKKDIRLLFPKIIIKDLLKKFKVHYQNKRNYINRKIIV